MADRVKQTAEDELKRVQALAKEAAVSGAYLYPLRGIYYFATHRELWKPLGSKLAPVFTLGAGITTFMFVVTYVPQAAVLALFEGPLAAVSTALLVLSESSTLFNVLSKTFLVEDALLETFDGTLVARNQTSLVSEGREVKAGGNPMTKLGKVLKKPFAKYTPTALIRYFMYLPLNFIPVVGTLLFIVLQGRRQGPSAHQRYFQLKGWNSSVQEAYVDKHKGAYTSFGVAATLLEMVPIVGMFFAFTNNVGAALWAADMEQRSSTAPGLRESARQAQ